MYDLGCMLVESRPFVVLDRLPSLYGLKYDSATACGLLLYLCSYKLDGSATSNDGAVVAVPLACARWRGRQGEASGVSELAQEGR